MTSGMYGSLSAVNAFGAQLNVTADNLANANSKGFKKSRVEMQDTAPNGQGVAAVVQRIDTPGAQHLEDTPQGTQLVEQSNVDYGEEARNLILTQAVIEANIRALHAQDNVLGMSVNIIR